MLPFHISSVWHFLLVVAVLNLTLFFGCECDFQGKADFGLKKLFSLPLYPCEEARLLKQRPCFSKTPAMTYTEATQTLVVQASNGLFFYNTSLGPKSHSPLFTFTSSIDFNCDFFLNGPLDMNSTLLSVHPRGLCNCDKPGEIACPFQFEVNITSPANDNTPQDSLAFLKLTEVGNYYIVDMAREVEGKLVLGYNQTGDDLTGCFLPSKETIAKSQGAILVLVRGGCYFDQKGEFASMTKAKGYIVVNTPNTPLPSNLISTPYLLPNVIVSYEDFKPYLDMLKQGLEVRGRFGKTVGQLLGSSSNARPPMGYVTVSTKTQQITFASKEHFSFADSILSSSRENIAIVLFPDGKNDTILLFDITDTLKPKLLNQFTSGKMCGVENVITSVINMAFITKNSSTILLSVDQETGRYYFFKMSKTVCALMSSGTVLEGDDFLLIYFLGDNWMVTSPQSTESFKLPSLNLWNITDIMNVRKVATIQEPTIIPSTEDSQTYSDCSASQNKMAVMTNSEGVQIYNVSDFSKPTLIGNLDTSALQSDYTVGANLGRFHSDSSFLFIYNNAQPSITELAVLTTNTHLKKRSPDMSKMSRNIDEVLQQATGDEVPDSLQVIDVQAGGSFTCALFNTKKIRCWGKNDNGQLGIGNRQSQGWQSPISKAVQLGSFSTVTQMSVGYGHSCAIIDPEGDLNSQINSTNRSTEVLCWGWGEAGQLGYGNTGNNGDDQYPYQTGPIQFTDGKVVLIRCGTYHTCAIISKGNGSSEGNLTVRCWGLNSNGQLGYGSIFSQIDASRVKDIQFSTTSKPQSIALGSYHSCVLFANGEVHCWGLSSSGQLGYGNTNDIGSGKVNTTVGPVPLAQPAIQLVAGALHTCALLVTRQTVCWGSNLSGQLGYQDPQNIGDDETPLKAGPLPLSYPVIRLTAGSYHTCALLNTSSSPTSKNGVDFRCWGRNDDGQLGIRSSSGSAAINSKEWANVSIGRIELITGGLQHTCGLIDKKVRCWGSGSSGYLGYYTTLNVGLDIPVSDGLDVPFDYGLTQIASSHSHTCAIVQPGNVRCWGSGTDGKLGYGNIDDQGSILPASSSGNVEIGGLVKQISVGFKHTCALTISGDVTCWGDSSYGQLGRGNTQSMGTSMSPIVNGFITVGGKVQQITTGAFHTCVLMANSSIRCWGLGLYGQLGLLDFYGTREYLGDNEPILSVPPINVFRKVIMISAGGLHTCALIDPGYVSCWGTSLNGKLGYGNKYQEEYIAEPTNGRYVDLGPGNLAQSVTCGFEHTCVLLSGKKKVMCWGSNFHGQLGYGYSEDIGDDEKPSDVGTINLSDDVEMISAGGFHTCVIVTGGKVKCWGHGTYGQLGNGNNTNTDRNTPASNITYSLITQDHYIRSISCGVYHTCAITSREEVICFGDGQYGKLGYGNFNNIGDKFTANKSIGISLGCGDGIESTYEECDDGNLIDGDGCDKYCREEISWICIHTPGGTTKCSKCGNYFTELLEECDDGNTQSNDGCSSICTVEKGFTCSKQIVCLPICGDGLVVKGEECDTGGSDSKIAAGCFNCKVVPGWNCTGEPSQCSTVCGDGVAAGDEECDFVILHSNSTLVGCGTDCRSLPGYKCNRSGVCEYKYKTPDYAKWSDPAAVIVIVLNLIGVCLTISVMIYFIINRQNPIIRTSNLVFCLIMQVGILIGYTNVFLWIGYPNRAQCVLRPWIASISFSLMLGPLSVKTWAIWQIFSNVLNNMASAVTVPRLVLHCGVIMAYFILICIVWTSVDTLEPAEIDEHLSEDKLVVRCDSSHRFVYEGLLFGGAIVLGAYNVFLALKTRHVSIEYNESKYIGLTIYNFVGLGGIVVALAYALARLPPVMTLVMFIGVFVVLTSTLAILFGSRILLAYTKQAPPTRNLTRTFTKTGYDTNSSRS